MYGAHMLASGGREVAVVFWAIWKMCMRTMDWPWVQAPKRRENGMDHIDEELYWQVLG
jgi:hypothetical protein